VKFLGRSPRRETTPYSFHPPYQEARARLLSGRPTPDDTVRPSGLFGVVADVGLETYLVSVYLFANGTISIYSSDGIHSTGLRGAEKVAAAATAIFEEVEAALGAFSRVADLAALPLPDRGDSQILVRTQAGDLAAADRLGSKHGMVAEIAAMAFILTQLARAAVIEGLDRVEAGDVRYQLAPEYRRIRSSLLDWLPEPGHIAAGTRVASVAVEMGEAEPETVTSLFAFADGSTSVYRSDGTLARGLTGMAGVAGAASALLDSIVAALPAFGPAGLIPPPQPGRVQFVVRARLGKETEWKELFSIASRAELEHGPHPLSAAFGRATEILRLAGPARPAR
jgi:hypothetical protein